MEDCGIYLPSSRLSPARATAYFEIATNFEMHRVTFRSTEYQFCKTPVILWMYKDAPSSSIPWSCEVTVVSTQLDFNGYEPDLQLDENFLLCTFEEDN